MDLKKYKEEAIALLGEYHKREAQIKLLEIEYQAMEQLTPGVRAVSYDQVSAHTNKIASPVEGGCSGRKSCRMIWIGSESGSSG